MPPRGSTGPKKFNHRQKAAALVAVEDAFRYPKFKATPKQVELMDLVRSGEYLYIAMGGGIRGTKTFGFLAILITLCRMFPGSRWAIVRKDLQTLRRNTLPSFNKIRDMAGGFVGEMNMSNWIATCRNGSQLLFFAESYNIDPDFERWKGLEVNGFLLEEASELNEGSKDKAIERAGSWIIPSTDAHPEPQQPPPFVFFSFNPCANWPRRTFYEPHKLGILAKPWAYLPATAADNPFIPDAVREAWKNLPPNLYARFVLGEWNFTDDPDQLIKYEWLDSAFSRDPDPRLPNRVGADIARYGNDTTAFAALRGSLLSEIVEYEQLSITQSANKLLKFCQRPDYLVDADHVNVDGVGMGAGVVDYCREKKYRVRDLVAGAKPIERKRLAVEGTVFKFKNLRSQMWWEFAEQLRLGKDVAFDPELPMPMRTKLIADLTAVHYSIDGDKVITIESKDDIKERIGRSTNVGDAVVQAYFDMTSPFPRMIAVPGTLVVSPYDI